MSGAELVVKGLTVVASPSNVRLIEEVDFRVKSGELVGIVGESGSGKTTLGLACLGFTKPGTTIHAGTLLLGDKDLRGTPQQVRAIRRQHAAYVPQSAGFALNPALRIRAQLSDRLRAAGVDPTEQRLLDMLDEVALPRESQFLKRYPHELSGGQQQRIIIAAAFANRPDLVLLDEPTTGLDVSSQERILQMLRAICKEHGVTGVFISHDLGAVAELCSRVAVMYAGRIVEVGPTADLLARSLHPYTQGLVDAVPDMGGRRPIIGIPGRAPSPAARSHACSFAARCAISQPRCTAESSPPIDDSLAHSARCFYPGQGGEGVRQRAPWTAIEGRDDQPAAVEVLDVYANHGRATILKGVSLTIPEGMCVGLVGESGSGKTTLCRAIIGLHDDYTGYVMRDGEALPKKAKARSLSQRRDIQYVFQSPYDSLNPRKTVAELLLQPIGLLTPPTNRSNDAVEELLELVGMAPSAARKFPSQLSGGERQRVAIARALAVNPRILICDEVTASLDVSVQASVVELLRKLQRDRELTVLFVTHNIALIRHLAQVVVVLKGGRIVEQGPIGDIFDDPQADYTRTLVSSAPDLWRSVDSWRAAAGTSSRADSASVG